MRSDHIEDKFRKHDARLREHGTRLKEHEASLANQGRILEKSNEILESLKNTHCEHIGMTRATHEIAAASYFRWHGHYEAGNYCLEVENMNELCEVRRIPRFKASKI